MTNANVISCDACDGFEGFNEEQFRTALAVGTVNYNEWVLKLLAARTKARTVLENELLIAASLDAASLGNELRPPKPVHPTEHAPLPSSTASAQNS
jgi:hypothetical protein